MKKLLLFLLGACYLSTSMGQVGSLDSLFGTNGFQFFDPVPTVTTRVLKVLAAPNKSLYVVYSSVNDELITVAKYFSDGTIDPAYGTAGYSCLVPMTFADASLQSDGKIVLAGSTRAGYYSDIHDDLLVVRLDVHGSPDLSFNNSGSVAKTYTATSYETTTSVTVSNDRIAVTGFSLSVVTNLAFYHVDVYDLSGNLISNFLFGDVVDLQIFDPSNFRYSLAIQDQKIVLATSTYDYFTGYNSALLRFNSDGNPDLSFGQGGVTQIINTVFIPPPVVAVQGDKIVVAAGTFNFVNNNFGMVVARYNNDGSPDSSFNGNGWQTTDIGPEPVTVKAITMQGKKIIIGANVNDPNTQNGEFVLTRFNDDGTLDKSFDGDGIQITGMKAYSFSLEKINVYGNRLFVTGLTQNADPFAVSGIVASYQLEDNTVSLACSKGKAVFTSKGLCTAVVKEIGPFLAPSPNDTAVTYTLSGATVGSGIGSVSDYTFNKGLTTVKYTMIADPSQSCTFNVTVKDREAPLITNASATLPVLWPPDHQMRDVEIRYKVSDNCGAVTTSVSVKSNEAETGLGAGDLPNDWQVKNPRYVRLRAERYELGKGRIYTVTITATDASGNTSKQTVEVTVPLSAPTSTNFKTVDGLQVKVLSNPSRDQFTMVTSSTVNEKISVSIFNEQGTIIEKLTGLPANGRFQLGRAYGNGVYYAEVMQGDEKKMVKLVKLH